VHFNRAFFLIFTPVILELMPVLHNYIMIDTPAFLSDPRRLEAIVKMIKQVLKADVDDDEAETHAAKLLEIIVLQCHNNIDNVLPSLLEIVFERLSREMNSTELRTMCIQVIIAALWSNTEVVIRTLDNVSIVQNRSVLLEFLHKWIEDIDCFFGVHDRKVCALGLSTLLQIASKRPHDVAQVADKILPSMCIVFENLERAYANRAQEELEDEYEDTDAELDDAESESDEEEEKKSSSRKMNGIENGSKAELGNSDDDDDDDEEDEEYDRTLLENFNSCIDENPEVDEFILFKDTLQGFIFICLFISN
jgi:importin-7